MNRPWVVPTIIGVALLLLVCCLCFVLLAGVGGYLFLNIQGSEVNSEVITVIPQTLLPTSVPQSTPVPSHVPPGDGQQIPQARPTPTIITIPAPDPGAAGETLGTLGDISIPISDAADLGRRLQGKINIPPTLEPPAVFPKVGDQQTFWASNTDTNEHYAVDATLRYITEHAYFWIDDNVSYSKRDLRNLAETFETQIYPTDREFFGSEWSPGVDGDPHLYILYIEGAGDGIAGMFSSADSINPALQLYSNGHEMFILNADTLTLDEEYARAVLAHEFQHMIHWYRDRNEDLWLNEGFSDLAMFINQYDIGGHDFVYALDPDIQLNDWPNDSSQTIPHYGASFLFLTYFLDRFGEQATQALVGHPENGLNSIDKLLQELNPADALRGRQIGADDVFSDWVLASFLQDKDIADGRYTYGNYPDAPQPVETDTIDSCDGESRSADVRQYGVDYISIRCDGEVTLRFEGDRQVGVLPANPFSGSYAFWSNKGDSSNMTLTRTFDFTSANSPLTLGYWTWYDIEEDWDYLYVAASEDGESWQLLNTPSGTDTNPIGSNYGWGYTGVSGGGPDWIQETVDLSQYAGKTVQLRFEYVTDGAVNGEGFLLDDVSIPEIGYFSDFEADEDGWEPAGFARIQNVLPQTFRLSLIARDRQTTVQYISLSPENTVDVPLSFAGRLDEYILVVSGTTRYTRQPAGYTLTVHP